MPANRKQKTPEQRFTTISNGKETYELWNSLTSDEENLVIEQLGLKKGGLALSKKDEQTQRLLFGRGAFGKVRLAKKGNKLFAVKKLLLKSKDEIENIAKEHFFGQMLEKIKIPNIAPSVDGILSTNKRGEDTVYLFMDKIASLGDGQNVKRLMSYLNSPDQREAILLHITRSLFQTVSVMHQNQIYHRDIKAPNVLVSATGQVYLSDFGAATTTNQALIKDHFRVSREVYAVSDLTDHRYTSPEVHGQILFKNSGPSNLYELLDSWRLGLTLLQLCGVIKENEGILTQKIDRRNDDGSIAMGWINELKSKYGTLTQEIVNDRFVKEIEKIKKESLHKIPVSLQKIIFSLLDVDINKRLKVNEALQMMQQPTLQEKNRNEQAFKNLIHNQISETLKNSVKKALKNESKSPWWFNKALQEFRLLLKQPDVTYEKLEIFLNRWIPDKKNRPSITVEQFEITVLLVRQKLQMVKPISTVSHVQHLRTSESGYNDFASMQHSVQASDYNDFASEQRNVPASDYNDFASEQRSVPASDYNDFASVQPNVPASDYNDISTTNPEKENALELTKKATVEKLNLEPIVEDKEFVRLQNNLKNAAHQLLAYVKSKARKNPSLKELEEKALNNINSSIQSIKNFFSHLVQDLEIKHDETKLSHITVDEIAVKTIFNRIMQIVSQLSIGKLMSFNKEELAAVKHMLTKDKDLLNGIEAKVSKEWELSNLIEVINKKIELIEHLNRDNSLYISSKKLNTEQFLNFESHARMYRARDKQSNANYIFSEFEDMRGYKLPSASPNELFRSFVVQALRGNAKKTEEIYIYCSSEALGKTIASSLASLNENANLKIYINDHQLSKKTFKSSRFGQFFKEKQLSSLSEKATQFTIEELTPQEILSIKNNR